MQIFHLPAFAESILKKNTLLEGEQWRTAEKLDMRRLKTCRQARFELLPRLLEVTEDEATVSWCSICHQFLDARREDLNKNKTLDPKDLGQSSSPGTHRI